jgi:hypothetical protein
MSHLEKNEMTLPISSAELKSEIAANTGLNCHNLAQRMDDCGQAGGAKGIRTAGTLVVRATTLLRMDWRSATIGALLT